MEKGKKLLTCLNRVKHLAATLKPVNVDIDDQELAIVVLNGLPSSYEGLIVALEGLGKEEKSCVPASVTLGVYVEVEISLEDVRRI